MMERSAYDTTTNIKFNNIPNQSTIKFVMDSTIYIKCIYHFCFKQPTFKKNLVDNYPKYSYATKSHFLPIYFVTDN